MFIRYIFRLVPMSLMVLANSLVYAEPSPKMSMRIQGGQGRTSPECVNNLLSGLIQEKKMGLKVIYVSDSDQSSRYMVTLEDPRGARFGGFIRVGGFDRLADESGVGNLQCIWINQCTWNDYPGVNLSIRDQNGKEILKDQSFCEVYSPEEY